tara:strand:+ start:1169 stop:1525 length:357 start_codon:yes stop_codon:yes gene_type:complete
MRMTEKSLKRAIRDIVVESWRDHSNIKSVAGGEQMVAKGYGSKIYGNAEKYFTLRIELDGRVDAKYALEGIEMQKGEVVSHEGNTIIAKFPYDADGNKGENLQTPQLVADNLAFWIGR